MQPQAPLEAKARHTSRPWRADDAKELLTKIGAETSLRYAIHLITAASLIATRRKAAAVEIEDVSKAYQLFIDVRRSTQFLIEYQARLPHAAGSAGCCLHECKRNILMCAAYMRATFLYGPLSGIKHSLECSSCQPQRQVFLDHTCLSAQREVRAEVQEMQIWSWH